MRPREDALIFTARKRNLRRLCFHKCLSVHREVGVYLWSRGCVEDNTRADPPGQIPPGRHALGRHLREDTPLADGQQAGSTYPTGMHS